MLVFFCCFLSFYLLCVLLCLIFLSLHLCVCLLFCWLITDNTHKSSPFAFSALWCARSSPSRTLSADNAISKMWPPCRRRTIMNHVPITCFLRHRPSRTCPMLCATKLDLAQFLPPSYVLCRISTYFVVIFWLSSATNFI